MISLGLKIELTFRKEARVNHVFLNISRQMIKYNLFSALFENVLAVEI